MMPGLRRMCFLSRSVVSCFCLLLLVSCNTGSRGEPPCPPGDPFACADPDGRPIIETLDPQFGCAGDVVSLIGQNFNLVPEENFVTFRANDGSGTEARGEVLSVMATGPTGNMNTPTSMTVRVPTGVRDSTIVLDVIQDGDLVTAQGSEDFCGCPVVVGVIYGNDNSGFMSANIAANITTTQVTAYGYNLSFVNSATFIDEDANLVAANPITPGVPLGANFVVPATMDAITIQVPNGVAINDCIEAALVTLRLTGPCTVDNSALRANDFPMRVQKSPGGAAGLVPATISGVLLPSGVRAGRMDVHFSLLSEPASELWDVRVEYEDPVGSGAWNPCTLVDTPLPGLLEDLVCGISDHPSRFGGLVGPGHVHRFTWDSALDLPGSGQTRLRLSPTPMPNSSFNCDPTVVVTEIIAYNNENSVGGVGSGAIVENFETEAQVDFTAPLEFTAASWDIGTGMLRGAGEVATTQSPFGVGTVDVMLDGSRLYEINTDIPEIVDVTDPAVPVVLLGAANPGGAVNEFHCRSFVWEAADVLNPDNVLLLGDQPLVIRVSGTGNQVDVVARLQGRVNLDGANGTAGSLAAAGTGGVGLLGGGAGGNGGAVLTNAMAQMITDVIPSTDGGNDGGKGGQATTYATLLGSSSPRAGTGGGGGFEMSGEAGRNEGTSLPAAPPGDGGPARGDSVATVVIGGSGGGGGGGSTLRTSGGNPLASRFGGGGGAGGGAIAVYVDGVVVVTGSITANGGDGQAGTVGSNGGGGGGGSGGLIAIRASGGIALAEENLLLARGGLGGGPADVFRGGHGSDGRIRLESNGGISYSGLSDFRNVEPSIGSVGVGVGIATQAIDVGTGVDGPLDLSAFPPGEYLVNTGPDTIAGYPPPGQIYDPNGMPVLAASAMSGTGEFEFTLLRVPQGYTVRAAGENPFILRVLTEATLEGVITVDGAPGGVPVFPIGADPVPGIGGRGGAGGGFGGAGGVSVIGSSVDGDDGSLPPRIPPELDGTLPPISSTGPTGDPLFIAPALPAFGGHSVPSGKPGSGGGAGFALRGVGGGGDTGGAPADGDHGDGGTEYGNNSFVAPSGDPLKIGGSGAGGGGGGAGSPGSAGGGGGGYLEINVGGAFEVASSAEILARGGNAYRAAGNGGNGGGGAGGAIVLRGRGLTRFEEPGPVISVLGGVANLDPSADPTIFVTYVPNDDLNGGSGSSGRIRIESPIGFAVETPMACPLTVTQADPTMGVCPEPSLGLLLLSGSGVSEARTKSYPVGLPGGAVFVDDSVFSASVATPAVSATAPTFRVLYRGASQSLQSPGTLTPFSDWSADVSTLNGAAVIQKRFLLFGASGPGGAALQPSLDRIETPFDF